MAGNEFRENPVGDVAEFEAIGIADHQDQAEHDPEQRRGDGLREALAEHGDERAAKEHQKRDLVGNRSEVGALQRADPARAVLGDKDQYRDQNADQTNPQQPLAHAAHPLRPRGRIGGVHRRKPRRQLRHDRAPSGLGQFGPARDLVKRAAATHA